MNYLALHDFLRDIALNLDLEIKWFHGRPSTVKNLPVDFLGLNIYCLPFTSSFNTTGGAQVNNTWDATLLFYMKDQGDSAIAQCYQDEMQAEIRTVTIAEQAAERFLRLVHSNDINTDLEKAADQLIINSGTIEPAIKDTINLLTGVVLTLNLTVPDNFDYCDLPIGILIAPTNLTATANGQTQIDLTWNNISNTAIQIERSLTSGSGFVLINTTAEGATSFSDTGLTAGTQYFYRVRAISGALTSDYSNEASAITSLFNPIDLTPELWLENKVSTIDRDTTGWPAVDSSTNGNHGTPNTGVALGFVIANSDYVDILQQINWLKTTTNTSSFSFWFKPEAGGIMRILSQGQSTGNEMYSLFCDINNNVVLQIQKSAVDRLQVQLDTVLVDDTWYYIVVTYDGSKTGAGVGGFINAVAESTTIEVNTLSSNTLTPTSNFTIGTLDSSSPLQFLNGEISDLRLWNIELSSAQVSELYKNSHSLGFLPTGTTAANVLAHWPMMEAEGDDDPIVHDLKGTYNGVFSTAAASPYNPWVTGIDVKNDGGVNVGTSGFNKYGLNVGTGTVSVLGAAITGVGTSFTTEYAVNDLIGIGNEVRRITVITDNTNMTVTSSMTTVSGQPHTRFNLGDTGTKGEQNIPGTAFDSTTDIYGNTIDFKEGYLNFKGGNHVGYDLGSGIVTSGDFSWIVPFRTQSLSADQVVFSNRTAGTGNGIDLIVDTSGNFIIRLDDGTVSTLASGSTLSVDTDYFLFGYMDSSGNVRTGFATTSGDAAWDTTETNLGTPTAGSANMFTGAHPDGSNPMDGEIKGDIIQTETQITLANAVSQITYIENRFA